ncbi:hypothetical protein TSTA_053920 [Talaromyces stipitatus ATCC 10500]|uniref:Uncharacterized protein n=1 Tax=Talaromyces stipitatus (strain ATCC 10500 / CBS 375.48 / QM 6759 / NRRL 1006) TaxID=441959 RepID=B8MPZ0_TALSN|nr:uncharacterized protein TSTA_053920 [Talaromyces stipitatus ATCC 10500]EED12880.1 hypothetical protein TSTA_053920 [Talaromyces stipitatus ATCC 10500]
MGGIPDHLPKNRDEWRRVIDRNDLKSATPETPSKQSTTVSGTSIPIGLPDDDDETSTEEYTTPSPITPSASISEELRKVMFPPIKDKNIVNTALDVFFNALTMHFDILRQWNWTPHRKSFVGKFKEASLKARVDGYLEKEKGEPYALIEVKPVIRETYRCRIQM